MSENKAELKRQVEDLLRLRDVAAIPFAVQTGRRKTASELREEVIEGMMVCNGMSREAAERAVDASI